MVWKKILLVLLSCCLSFTAYAKGKFDFGSKNQNQPSAFQFMQEVLGIRSVAPKYSRQLQIIKPIFDDFFMANSGLPFEKINSAVIWGKYVCFANNGLACLDKTDPQNLAKIIYPFDLLNGDLVDEFILDVYAKDNDLFVATYKSIYKFTLNSDGVPTKNIVLEEQASQVVAYKGKVVYFDDGVLSAIGADMQIPDFDSVFIKDLLSTKTYLIIVTEKGIFTWKEGVGDWEKVTEDESIILGIAAEHENNKLYMAIKLQNEYNVIEHIYLESQQSVTKIFWYFDEEITNLFLDGNKLYKVSGNEISSTKKNDKSEPFNYEATVDTKQTITNVADGAIYAVSEDGIQFFINNGISSQSKWSKLIKPTMLSVKGGSFTKGWDGGLFLIKDGALYYTAGGKWQKKLDKVSGFAVSGNYGLIYNGFAIKLVDFADILDGAELNIKGSIKDTKLVQAMTADDEKVFIARSDHIFECPLPKDTNIDLSNCIETKLDIDVNDFANVPSLEEVLVCAEEGLYRLTKGTDNLKLFIDKPCKAVTFADEGLYMASGNGEILLLDNSGKTVKQLCKKLQPMSGGLESYYNYIYISDFTRGVVGAKKDLFTGSTCETTE